ncbi:MAG: F0F1 ATP synthase subunit alpha [Bacillales bacterium]|jgi:F-type H+-transporting ATPase subunit alpha|nr:F0F1 ATP synthase subunit alpha [Bacillales bacterium]
MNKYNAHTQGVVLSISDNIALVSDLLDAMLGELVFFANGSSGMVLNLLENNVGIILFAESRFIDPGDIVSKSGKIAQVPVGDGLLGRVVSALGEPLDDLGALSFSEYRDIEALAPSVMQRSSVDTPLLTGIKVIDGLIPIGRGQRELIIGDRQTGKTALAVDTILNQKGQNVYCVYVAIGQKNSSVVQIVNTLKKREALDYTTIVLSNASDLPARQYLAPYSGMAIAEYWLHQGKDVLIVFDDLSKHAIAYRTISLLLRRSPGREAYPGDVFYLHSRLLERAAKLNKENGGGSITALPIVETQSGDISAYIPTNVISITDGQLFLQTDLFNSGQRPAIDVGLSVSRVGSSAQYQAMKQVAGSLKIELANFKELQTFTQFGSDLDIVTKNIIEHGVKVLEVLKQYQYLNLSFADEVLELFASKNRTFRDVHPHDIARYCYEVRTLIKEKHPEIIEEINREKKLSDVLSKRIKTIMLRFSEEFIKEYVS